MSLVDDQPAKKYFPNQLPVHIKRVGRPHGTRNWSTKTAKENIQSVFDGLGGWEEMLEWARTHRTLFYGEVYPRLLAKEGAATKGEGITVIIQGRTKDKPLDNADITDVHAQVVDVVDSHTPHEGV